MEKKNTILLTVIAVATLLVAVVGATFAYFTATAKPSGNGDTSEATTATMASVKLTASVAGNSENTVYPGTKNYAGMHVKATKEGTGSANDDYTITYTVKGSVTLGSEFTAGTVEYTLYRVDTTPVNNVVTCPGPTETATATGTQYTETCTLASQLGEDQKIATGSGTVTGTTAPINVTGQTLSTTGVTDAYYYLVVEYKNENKDQNADQNKTITVALDSVEITNTEAI